jgi:hypothetical protein
MTTMPPACTATARVADCFLNNLLVADPLT